MALTDDDVREILRLIDESDLDELRIETEGFTLHVVRGGAEAPAPDTAAPATSASPPAASAGAPAAASAAASDPPAGGEAASARPGAASQPPASNGATATIAAPMPGTFYRAEGPGMAPFVDVGAQVEPDTVVCIIEIMKMMNSVPAGVSGTIVEICADDAQQVGDGAPLFRVET